MAHSLKKLGEFAIAHPIRLMASALKEIHRYIIGSCLIKLRTGHKVNWKSLLKAR
jgi:hypothetical protein